MPDRRVAFLRGINVGSAKRIAMADLRRLFEGLGYADVRTLLNSGNVVFTVVGKTSGDPGARIEKAITDRLGVAAPVTVLPGRDLAAAIEGNPLAPAADDPSRLLLMVFGDAKGMLPLRGLLAERWAPEALALGRRVAYLWCAGGIARSRLWAAANRVTGDAGTARNLATMKKLLGMIQAP